MIQVALQAVQFVLILLIVATGFALRREMGLPIVGKRVMALAGFLIVGELLEWAFGHRK